MTILTKKELTILDNLLEKLQNSAGQGKVTRTKRLINTFGLAELYVILNSVNLEINNRNVFKR